MGIFPLPTANTLDVMSLVRDDIAEIEATMPTGMTVEIAYDVTEYIETSIVEVGKTLAETLAIVMLVIFLFLGSFRSVLVPIAAIPISLIGAVFLMQLFGFSINLLTLLAIVLAVGLVVDDAIVVVENVERHIAEGKGRVEAAMLGARELVGPVIAMTVTLVAVYLPDRSPGRAHGLAVPRVRVHARGRGDHLRCRGADPLADDVGGAPSRR